MTLHVRREVRKEKRGNCVFVLRYMISFTEEEKSLVDYYQLWDEDITFRMVKFNAEKMSARYLASGWIVEEEEDIVRIVKRLAELKNHCESFQGKLTTMNHWNTDMTFEL